MANSPAIDLSKDETFRQLIMDQRSTALKQVTHWERFLGLPLTRDLRKEVKKLRTELKELRASMNS